MKTKIYALGGLEEVGKNTYCIEHNNEIIIIDAGLKFPNKFFLGVDIIIPDYQYLVANKHKIKGLFITHGHEDHIGGIKNLIEATQLKTIYSPKFAADLIKNKIKNNKTTQIITYKNDSVFKFQHFKVHFFAITHSIPFSYGVVVETVNGTIVYTGDFKLDWTPLGNKTEIHKISLLGQAGVDLLLADSTNSEISGFTLTEHVIIDNIRKIIRKYRKRIFITTFASNMNRIIQFILAAEKSHRKVLILGKAIDNVLKILKEKKYFPINFDILITVDKLKAYRPEQLLIICTGSQGEKNSVISKLVYNQHPKIHVNKNDLFIFSSRPIPGNRYSVDNIINKLKKFNADVKTDNLWNRVHTSGHAAQEEQKIIIELLKPKYFMPVHGEYRMLIEHKKTAVSMGINSENVFVIPNGQQIELFKHHAKLGDKIPANPIFLSGKTRNPENSQVLNERQILLTSGLAKITCIYERNKKQITQIDHIFTYGLTAFANDSQFIQQIHNKIKEIGSSNLFAHSPTQHREETIKKELINLFYKVKKLNPTLVVFVLK